MSSIAKLALTRHNIRRAWPPGLYDFGKVNEADGMPVADRILVASPPADLRLREDQVFRSVARFLRADAG